MSGEFYRQPNGTIPQGRSIDALRLLFILEDTTQLRYKVTSDIHV